MLPLGFVFMASCQCQRKVGSAGVLLTQFDVIFSKMSGEEGCLPVTLQSVRPT